ncbi:FMN-dependent NADH-azoreductase [Pseudobacteroides sp.]|uniref:FMN-dependent NADH-azoreductase n=1 Tax=Pseudobacteroides sp. TaxID=1968840 RepID=UPI002FDC98E5
MSTVLYIKANAKPEGASRTFIISDKFMETYRDSHPNDKIITLNLYKENIRFLSEGDINTVFGPKNEDSRNNPILKYAYQFAEADKYVIAEPMWNLSIPAILKSYIDYITVTGITFKYTENGAVGLLQNKKPFNLQRKIQNRTCLLQLTSAIFKNLFYISIHLSITVNASALDNFLLGLIS